jgi:hypothetical protein
MVAGDRVFVAYALRSGESRSMVIPASLVAVGGGDEVVARDDYGVLHTAGSRYCRAFTLESNAWTWCVEKLRAWAREIEDEADRCESVIAAMEKAV